MLPRSDHCASRQTAVPKTPPWLTTLQGWAVLHNDTDEHWRNVKVTLVNGRPDSFIFPLAAPCYARRELVTPENEASTVPQLLGQTVDATRTPSRRGSICVRTARPSCPSLQRRSKPSA